MIKHLCQHDQGLAYILEIMLILKCSDTGFFIWKKIKMRNDDILT